MLSSQATSTTPSSENAYLLAARYAKRRSNKRQTDRERIHAQVVHPIDTPRLIRDPLERRQSRLISTITAARLLVSAALVYLSAIIFFFVVNHLIGEHSVYRPAQRIKVRMVKTPLPRKEPPAVKALAPLKGPVKPDFIREKPEPKPPQKKRHKKPKQVTPLPQQAPDESKGASEQPVVGLDPESTVPGTDGPAFAVGSTRMGTTERHATDFQQGEFGSGSGGNGKGLVSRNPGPSQFSLWLDPQKFVQMALISPVTTLLVSVPGYGDLIRGSQIRPFVDLISLRLRLTSFAPGQLVLAGRHKGGEQALLEAAQRIASMRNREPVWSGGPQLRSTSWVDGSGADRALAVHHGAFLIAPRATMATLLSVDPPQNRILEMSRLHKRAYFDLKVEDASRYLPEIGSCALQAIRLSLGSGTDSAARLELIANYKSAWHATRARACLQGLQKGGTQLSFLANWLATAEGSANSYTRRLQIGIAIRDIDRLIDALSWAIRTSSRAKSRSAARP